jgi:putative ABC transport system substrate-binding protein
VHLGILALALVLLTTPLSAAAQPAGKVHRIGWLGLPGAAGNADLTVAFRDELRQLGYVEGRNIVIDYRFADGQIERLSTLAVELIELRPDAIVVTGSQAAMAARRATATHPIVMVSVGDPVGIDLIASLAKPGGNITGISAAHGDIAAKWIELLREVVPRASRIGYLDDLDSPVAPIFVKHVLAAGRTLGVSMQVFSVTRPDDVEPQLRALTRAGVQALAVGPNPVPRTKRKEIVEFVARERLPAVYAGRDYAEAGGLMSYNPSRPDQGRRGALYVDRILKGAKPADLPVEQPTKFELVINLKTAKALDLTIPPSLMLRADQVLE